MKYLLEEHYSRLCYRKCEPIHTTVNSELEYQYPHTITKIRLLDSTKLLKLFSNWIGKKEHIFIYIYTGYTYLFFCEFPALFSIGVLILFLICKSSLYSKDIVIYGAIFSWLFIFKLYGILCCIENLNFLCSQIYIYFFL